MFNNIVIHNCIAQFCVALEKFTHMGFSKMLNGFLIYGQYQSVQQSFISCCYIRKFNLILPRSNIFRLQTTTVVDDLLLVISVCARKINCSRACAFLFVLFSKYSVSNGFHITNCSKLFKTLYLGTIAVLVLV